MNAWVVVLLLAGTGEILSERDAAIANANQAAVRSLTTQAKALIAQGDVPGATEAWEAVLKIDKDNKTALNYFDAIGKEPKTTAKPKAKKRAEERAKRPLLIEYRSSDAVYQRQQSGVWIERRGKVTTEFQEVARNPHWVLIRHEKTRYRLHHGIRFSSTNGIQWRISNGEWVR